MCNIRGVCTSLVFPTILADKVSTCCAEYEATPGGFGLQVTY